MLFHFVPQEVKFFDLFDQQADNMVKIAAYFKEMVKNSKFDDEAIKKMHEMEHEGDTLSHEVIDALNKTFVTPFDREDILDLTNTIDDVVDCVHAIATRMRLYKLTAPDQDMMRFAEHMELATDPLAKAIKGLRDLKRQRRIIDYCIEVNRIENMGDQIREDAIGRLFDHTTDPIQVIKWKEIYEAAESMLDVCEHVAKGIESIVVKQG